MPSLLHKYEKILGETAIVSICVSSSKDGMNKVGKLIYLTIMKSDIAYVVGPSLKKFIGRLFTVHYKQCAIVFTMNSEQ